MIDSFLLTYAYVALRKAAKMNIRTLPRQKNISLICGVDATWYVRSSVACRILKQISINEVMETRAKKVFAKSSNHPEMYLRQLLDYNPPFVNKLKRSKWQILANAIANTSVPFKTVLLSTNGLCSDIQSIHLAQYQPETTNEPTLHTSTSYVLFNSELHVPA